MGLAEAVEAGYRNYFNFSGRATRAAYWWFVLWNALLLFTTVMLAAVAILIQRTNPPGALVAAVLALILGLFLLASCIPQLAAEVRRLRDAGHSGKWVLAQIGLIVARGGLLAVDHRVPGLGLHLAGLGLALVSLGIDIAIFIFLVQPSRQDYGKYGYGR